MYHFLKIASSMLLFCVLLISPTIEARAIQNLPHKPMVIVFAAGYPPYSEDTENGEAQGILIEMAKEVLQKKLYIPLELKIYPWKRSQEMVRQGLADAFITVPTIERSIYTEIVKTPILVTEFAIFIGANNPKIKSIELAKNLDELRVLPNISTGYLIGSGWHIEKLFGFQSITSAAKLSQILKMVDDQRLDIYIDNSLVVNYHLHLLKLNDRIVKLPNIMDKPTWNLCIGKKSFYANLVGTIESEIKKLSENGELEIIRNDAKENYQL